MSLSQFFFGIAVLLIGSYIARRYFARSRVGRVWLAVYDGRTTRLERGVMVEEGVKSVASQKVYMASELLAARSQDGTDLYIFGAEHIALATHEALEAARLVMLPRMLFQGGGDLKKWLEYAALVLPLLAAIWLTLKIGDFQASVNRIDATLQSVQKSLDTPRVVIPKPEEEK